MFLDTRGDGCHKVTNGSSAIGACQSCLGLHVRGDSTHRDRGASERLSQSENAAAYGFTEMSETGYHEVLRGEDVGRFFADFLT